MEQLTGYRRSDGTVGIRNKILILPTCSCSSPVAAHIAAGVEGAVTFSNQTGCSQTNEDLEYTSDALAGFAANPNVYGTVIIGVGCEVCGAERLAGIIRERTNKPLFVSILQRDGGTAGVIAKCVQAAREMAGAASRIPREPVSWSELILATECGGSDATSGLSANPVVGYVSDQVVDKGGSVILSETPEMIGAEHLLARRAITPDIGKRVLDMVHGYEQYMQNLNTNLRDSNPAPGNIQGGISTLEEKSLGCIYKAGNSPVVDVVKYAEKVTKKGLTVMDTPGNDACSLTGMAAGGAQLAVFTTGRGTPVGNPIMPVIKLTGNSDTMKMMECDMDLCTGATIEGTATIEQMGQELLGLVQDVVNGYKTKAEVYEMSEVAVARYCNFT